MICCYEKKLCGRVKKYIYINLNQNQTNADPLPYLCMCVGMSIEHTKSLLFLIFRGLGEPNL